MASESLWSRPRVQLQLFRVFGFAPGVSISSTEQQSRTYLGRYQPTYLNLNTKGPVNIFNPSAPFPQPGPRSSSLQDGRGVIDVRCSFTRVLASMATSIQTTIGDRRRRSMPTEDPHYCDLR